MDILITGGGGLLGRQLTAALLDRGDRVRVLALPDEETSWLDARWSRGLPRRHLSSRDLGAANAGADAVMHLAGMIGRWLPLEAYTAVNVTGTENVCRAALAEAVDRVVAVSSWTVYGMDQGAPCHEDHPLTPFPEPYAISKAAGDQLVQSMVRNDGLPAVIVRPGTFFGPGDRLHFGRIADRLRAGRGILVGRGDNALPLVYVSDVVHGLLLALDHPDAVGEAFNITNDAPLTQQEFFEAVATAVGAERPRVHVPYRPLYAAAAVAERVASWTRSSRQPPATRLGVKAVWHK